MDLRAIEKANSRLRIARQALLDIKQCSTRTAFIDAWYTYLVAAKNVYTVLEQGAKTNAQSRQWFGLKKAERKSDELLQYIFQSRDDDEHGLGLPVDYQPPSFEFGENDGGSSYRIIEHDDGGSHIEMNIKSKDGKGLVKVKGRIPLMVLQPVVGRGPVTYAPPKRHNNVEYDEILPHKAAELNLAYLESLVSDAEALA
jgi:hypothetical protein